MIETSHVLVVRSSRTITGAAVSCYSARVCEDDSSPVTTSEAVTEGVRVNVEAYYSAEHSDPMRCVWYFLYTIRISNEGNDTVQLTHQNWYIVDGTGETEEEQGPGADGDQPVLEPGQSFEYTSGCGLMTPLGSMTGTFRMQRSDGTVFEAEIALFEMIRPASIH